MIIYVSKLVARSLLVRQYFFRTLHRRLTVYQDFEDIVAVLKLSAQLNVDNTSMQFKYVCVHFYTNIDSENVI